MTLLKTNQPVQTVSLPLEVAAPRDLSKGLGLLRGLQVREAEKSARAEAAKELALYAAQASGDVARQAMELRASELKAALAARSTAGLSAINTELLGRYGQSKLQMRATHGEVFKGQICLRHELFEDLKRLAAAGYLTAEELAEAGALVEADAAEDIQATRTATRQAMEAMDAHVARATDHIAKQQPGY